MRLVRPILAGEICLMAVSFLLLFGLLFSSSFCGGMPFRSAPSLPSIELRRELFLPYLCLSSDEKVSCK